MSVTDMSGSDTVTSGPVAEPALDLIAVATSATVRRRDRQKANDADLQVKAAAIWSMYHERGHSAPQIARELQAALAEAGVPESAILGQGVGQDTVRRIVAGPKPQP